MDLFQPPNTVGKLHNRTTYEGGTMRKITRLLMFFTAVALALPAFADTLILKSGEKVTGYYQGGTARVIKFQTADGAVKDYDILSVEQIQFGDSATAAASAPAAPSSRPPADPRLLPGNQRVTRPTPSTGATTGYTIPTGGEDRHPRDRQYKQREEQAG